MRFHSSHKRGKALGAGSPGANHAPSLEAARYANAPVHHYMLKLGRNDYAPFGKCRTDKNGALFPFFATSALVLLLGR